MSELDSCGGCQGTAQSTPVLVDNRPNLSAIAVRAGTHAQFKASLLAGLSSASRPALQSLQTREDDDFSIALLDGWAVVADVLTFYSERIANESYLRTATERRSVLELARTIGYELDPGVAASTYLAFTVEQAPGAPGYAQVGTGTRVQSIPGPGELPQTYETVEAILARGQWNVLRARSVELVTPYHGLDRIYLKGTTTNLRGGDALLIVGDERKNDPARREWDFRKVKSLEAHPDPDAERAFTVVFLDRPLGSYTPWAEPAKAHARVYALRQRAGLFGAAAPEFRAMPQDLRDRYDAAADATGTVTVTRDDWPGLRLSDISDSPTGHDQGTGLWAEYFDRMDLRERKVARTDAQLNFAWASGVSPAPGVAATTYSVRWTGWVEARADGAHTFTTNSDDGVRVWIDGTLVVHQWTDHAPREDSGTIDLRRGRKYAIRVEYYNNGGPGTLQLSWAYPGQVKQLVPTTALYPADVHTVHLDAIYPGIVVGSWLVLSIPSWHEAYQVLQVTEDARAGFTLNARTTRLTLRGVELREKFDEEVRQTAVFAQSEPLEWAPAPTGEEVHDTEIVLDRVLDEPPPAGRTLILQSQRADGTVLSEVATVKTALTQDGATHLVLSGPLQHAHPAALLSIYANVAFATHGETVAEVMGSGDATQPNQKFLLRQAPLTYVPDANPSGGKTTLEVWVNEVKWREVPTFFGQGPRDRVYLTRRADDGKVTVTFGDGVRGARLPTGRENVRAVYRKGIGTAGLVAAEQLKLLLTRPLGVKSVTNPEASAGADEPQRLADARKNAPTSVLLLDRVVSLADYEDFARNLNGIAKAQAAWTWSSGGRGVFLTVAGPLPAPAIPDDSKTLADLLRSLQESGNPLVRVAARSFTPTQFRLAGKVRVAADREPQQVKAAVASALRAAFSFDSREFGQPVALSEVVAVIQDVPGVRFVDLDALYAGTVSKLDHFLPAHRPADGAAAGAVQPAELLTLDESSLDALEVTAA